MSEPRIATGFAVPLYLMAAGTSLVGLFTLATSHGAIDRVAPAGALYVDPALPILHGFAILPLAYLLARRCLARVPERVATLLALVALGGVAVALQPGSGLLGSAAQLPARLSELAPLRSAVALLALLPGVCLALLGSRRLLGWPDDTKRDPLDRTTPLASDLDEARTPKSRLAWGLIPLAFAVALPWGAYPVLFQNRADRMRERIQDGYLGTALAGAQRLARAGGGDAIQQALGVGGLARLAASVAEIERGASAVPTDSAGRAARAGSLIALGHYPEAEAELLRFLTEQPGNPGALHGLGAIAFVASDYRQAFEWFRREAAATRVLATGRPGDAGTRERLRRSLVWQARAALALRRVREGKALLTEALAVGDNAETRVLLAQLLVSMGRGREAQAELDRAAALAPAAPGRYRSLRRDILQNTADCAAAPFARATR